MKCRVKVRLVLKPSCSSTTHCFSRTCSLSLLHFKDLAAAVVVVAGLFLILFQQPESRGDDVHCIIIGLTTGVHFISCYYVYYTLTISCTSMFVQAVVVHIGRLKVAEGMECVRLDCQVRAHRHTPSTR